MHVPVEWSQRPLLQELSQGIYTSTGKDANETVNTQLTVQNGLIIAKEVRTILFSVYKFPRRHLLWQGMRQWWSLVQASLSRLLVKQATALTKLCNVFRICTSNPSIHIVSEGQHFISSCYTARDNKSSSIVICSHSKG